MCAFHPRLVLGYEGKEIVVQATGEDYAEFLDLAIGEVEVQVVSLCN